MLKRGYCTKMFRTVEKDVCVAFSTLNSNEIVLNSYTVPRSYPKELEKLEKAEKKFQVAL